MRYARPEFLNALAHEMPLPMIVDAECGMPLDLGRWESLWLGEDLGDTSGGDIKLRWAALDAGTHASRIMSDSYADSAMYQELNPDPYNLPLLDPEDAALLAELAPAAPSFGGNSQTASGPSTPLPAHVPWLRKTEYISREGVQRSGAHESCVSIFIRTSQSCRGFRLSRRFRPYLRVPSRDPSGLVPALSRF